MISIPKICFDSYSICGKWKPKLIYIELKATAALNLKRKKKPKIYFISSCHVNAFQIEKPVYGRGHFREINLGPTLCPNCDNIGLVTVSMVI